MAEQKKPRKKVNRPSYKDMYQQCREELASSKKADIHFEKFYRFLRDVKPENDLPFSFLKKIVDSINSDLVPLNHFLAWENEETLLEFMKSYRYKSRAEVVKVMLSYIDVANTATKSTIEILDELLDKEGM